MPGQTGQGFNYTNITTNTTTTIANGIGPTVSLPFLGIVHTIVVNTAGATGGTITIYDSPTASGEVVATITVPNAAQSFTAIYDIQLNYGLTVVTATMTAPDITVTWI